MQDAALDAARDALARMCCSPACGVGGARRMLSEVARSGEAVWQSAQLLELACRPLPLPGRTWLPLPPHAPRVTRGRGPHRGRYTAAPPPPPPTLLPTTHPTVLPPSYSSVAGVLIDSDGAAPAPAPAAQQPGTRALGEALLVDTFLWQPHARGPLLAAAFSSMVERAGASDLAAAVRFRPVDPHRADQRRARPLALISRNVAFYEYTHAARRRGQGTYLRALRAIAATHAHAMRELAAPLAHALALLWLAPRAVARPALAAFVPACRHAPALRDKVAPRPLPAPACRPPHLPRTTRGRSHAPG